MNVFDLLASRLLLPAYLRWKGDRRRRWIPEVEHLFGQPLAVMRRRQLERLRRICAVGAEHSRFYRERFAQAGIDDPAAITFEQLRDLPLLTKDDLRSRARDILNERFRPEELVQSATGGTTSSPVRIYLDREALDRRWAASAAFERWAGHVRGAKTAFLWGAPQDFPQGRSWKQRIRLDWVERVRFYPTLPLDEATLERYERDLRRYRPSHLQAYPVPLEIFARFLVERGRTLPIPSISCSAEPLLPHQIELAEQAFGSRPFNFYGSRELGRLASECRLHDGLHVNVYGLFVEIEPDPDLADSRLGQIVVTDLWNEAFPMIRYRTDDVGELTDAPCPCGVASPRLIRLVGRIGDVFVNSRGQKIPGVALPNRIVGEDDQIQAIQLRQHAPTRFEALIVPGPRYSSETLEWLRRRIADYMDEPAQAVQLEARLVDAIPREPSGKVRFSINMIGR